MFTSGFLSFLVPNSNSIGIQYNLLKKKKEKKQRISIEKFKFIQMIDDWINTKSIPTPSSFPLLAHTLAVFLFSITIRFIENGGNFISV